MIPKYKKILKACLENNNFKMFQDEFEKNIISTIKKAYRDKGVRYIEQDIKDRINEMYEAICKDNYKKLRQYDEKEETSFRVWLGIIVYRRMLNYIRSIRSLKNDSRKVIKAPFSDEMSAQISFDNTNYDYGNSGSPLEIILKKENEIFFQGLLAQLDQYEKLVLQLHFYNNLTISSIAELLLIPVKSVSKYKKDGLNNLKKILKKRNIRRMPCISHVMIFLTMT